MEAPVIQYLNHGKALCGRVFKAFVETFNWHNDFCKNLKGDADLPGNGGGNGSISVDRSDPRSPIIRLTKTTKEESKEDPSVEPLPWTYAVVDGIGTWLNPKYQFGYELHDNLHGVAGQVNPSLDGAYYLEWDARGSGLSINRAESEQSIPATNIYEAKVRIYIATIVDGVQVGGPHMIPVIYKYL